MAVRVSLTDRISIEADGVVVDEQRFPGRQGRLVFAYLLAAQGRPVPRDELADALWGDELPAKWEKALSVLVSKLRALLNECGVDGATSLTSAFGCYKLTLPAGSWIDVAAAAEAASAAERALAADDLDGAVGNASSAASLARTTFLPGEDGRWVDKVRDDLREILVRALEYLAEANLSRDPAAAARAADELIVLEPFRDRGYRLLMQAQSAAGNDAEALRTYERCRALLAEELGAYPSPETAAVYREVLQRSPMSTPVDVDQPEINGVRATPPPLALNVPTKRNGRMRAALVAVVLLIAGAALAAFVLTSRDEPPPEVLPNSVVRLDPKTLEPIQVVPVGFAPDFVVVAGGFVWITHQTLRDSDSGALRNAGDRTLTRVDPSTGHAVVVGGGLAPCGLTAEPSGDVWVANCFASGSGPSANVVRVDAKTLKFKATWRVPGGAGFYRGLAYGGGWLWVADVSGAVDFHGVTRVDPRTGVQRSIPLSQHAGALAWSEGYGDLWMNDFLRGSVSRMHAATGAVKTFDSVGVNPASLVVNGDAVWVGDWSTPQLIRLRAVGAGRPRSIALPTVKSGVESSVWTVAAGAGAIWATTPRDRALWRIDPETNGVTRIPMPYSPAGVAAGDDEIWVTVRSN